MRRDRNQTQGVELLNSEQRLLAPPLSIAAQPQAAIRYPQHHIGILRNTKAAVSAATATMGFMGLTSPFKKDSVDSYQGVLVPLANAARHPTVVAEYARRRSAANDSSDGNSDDPLKKDAAKPGKENGVMRTSSEGYSPYTVEGLSAEIHEDVTASGHDSAYDCEFSL